MECLLYAAGKADSRGEKKLIKKAVAAFFQRKKKEGTVSIHFLSAEKMREMNARFRGKKKVTDVLSFAVQEGEPVPKAGAREWGDIFICLPQIKKQAKERGITYQNELRRMGAHGILHLWGFDHQTSATTKKMLSLQEKLVARK